MALKESHKPSPGYGGKGVIINARAETAAQIARVTSKGGTTERAMAVLYGADLAGTLETAMKACTKRADELATRN